MIVRMTSFQSRTIRTCLLTRTAVREQQQSLRETLRCARTSDKPCRFTISLGAFAESQEVSRSWRYEHLANDLKSLPAMSFGSPLRIGSYAVGTRAWRGKGNTGTIDWL